ncbi:HoxN/HupN/NixA family nickel/cobalt transporter [Dyella mobilis]|nr:HoxN/HupN/NixA family nickel/cobalt transporter [Dyella mobilis]
MKNIANQPRNTSLITASMNRTGIRTRLIVMYTFLLLFNLVSWTWAIVAFGHRPDLLGVCLLIYGLGLRHAVDADHITAIDNVTRKLMQDNKRPTSVGFWFAIGHSSIIIVVAILVASAEHYLSRFDALRSIGSLVSTSISVVFLMAIAIMNVTIFFSLYRNYRTLKQTGRYQPEKVEDLLNQRGFLSKILMPLFRLVSKSWQMVFLGLAFGLSFDTATEIAMFTVSAKQVASGISVGTIAVLPLLFAAGMTLVDTTDGVMMLKAYEWAFINPIRKIYYNMAITLISVCIAVFIAGVEAMALLADKFSLGGGVWKAVQSIEDHFNELGFSIIAILLAVWMASYLISLPRTRRTAVIKQ